MIPSRPAAGQSLLLHCCTILLVVAGANSWTTVCPEGNICSKLQGHGPVAAGNQDNATDTESTSNPPNHNDSTTIVIIIVSIVGSVLIIGLIIAMCCYLRDSGRFNKAIRGSLRIASSTSTMVPDTPSSDQLQVSVIYNPESDQEKSNPDITFVPTGNLPAPPRIRPSLNGTSNKSQKATKPIRNLSGNSSGYGTAPTSPNNDSTHPQQLNRFEVNAQKGHRDKKAPVDKVRHESILECSSTESLSNALESPDVLREEVRRLQREIESLTENGISNPSYTDEEDDSSQGRQVQSTDTKPKETRIPQQEDCFCESCLTGIDSPERPRRHYNRPASPHPTTRNMPMQLPRHSTTEADCDARTLQPSSDNLGHTTDVTPTTSGHSRQTSRASSPPVVEGTQVFLRQGSDRASVTRIRIELDIPSTLGEPISSHTSNISGVIQHHFT